jgi:lipoxygenase
MDCRGGVDPETEKRSSQVYVPRDEQFSDVKGRTFSATTLRSGLHAILPALAPLLNNTQHFSHFPAIDALYSDGIPLPVDSGASLNVINNVIPPCRPDDRGHNRARAPLRGPPDA